ncbi:MAG: peptidoglycan DD-metalloendopeptidase family protein [Dehalococcoidia bacterium]|nr:peptidoglycan DD-metalloendopeptidase family protein [Dehalococcoidia bacterium]
MGSSIPSDQSLVVRPPAINKTLPAPHSVPTQAQVVAAELSALSVAPTATAVPPAEGAAVRAASVAPPPDLPVYQVYQVAEGDTVSGIAARFGIQPQYIIVNNPEIQDSNFLKLGQSVIVPAGNGILHEVRYGETLSDIATRYNVTVNDITSFAANHIATPDAIKETQFIYVPNGVVPTPPPPAAPAPPPADSPTPVATTAPAPAAAAPKPPASGGGSAPPRSSSRGLIWPVRGPISSMYGGGHPLGIDIDGYNSPGAPILAATDGQVIFAGGNPCCSYGLYVIVVSPNGIQTLYAHMSAISVSSGQNVGQGESLGIIGNTGYSTGRHLHFEVIDNGVRRNPLDYLPGPYSCDAGIC